MEWVFLATGLVVGILLGGVWAWWKQGVRLERLRGELQAEKEKTQWISDAEKRLSDAFRAAAGDVLHANSELLMNRSREQLIGVLEQARSDWGTQREQIHHLVDPLSKGLEAMDSQVRVLEQRREGAYRSLERLLTDLGSAQAALRTETVELRQAMKSSSARGRWGEIQLRRVVELAGMANHVDFEEQAVTDEGRPDMLIHLPNQGVLPVDAKTPMTAFLAASEAGSGDETKRKLAAHAKAMRQRIQELARKTYWEQFDHSASMLIMFVPSEAALAAAFEEDPELLEYAAKQKILVASPVTLLALLRTAAFGWQQVQIADNAQEIAAQGKELYGRLMTFLSHFRRTGEGLGRALKAYNEAVGSMERMLLPAARRFKDLSAEDEPLPSVESIDSVPRQLPLETDES
ncbi:DNA recombination protein RmuC [Candidatus Bipolaricaulota bacterium]|nr:DNA recombination protein RmuC [Candidatus Bipolaricaulota bacterium]